MKKLIGQFIFWLSGWKIQLEGDKENLNRCILVVAPHTSNWDYVLGILTYWQLKKTLKVIIKDTHTKAFYGGIIKRIGAIGIDRSQKNDLINIISKKFESENFSLVITPEGSRAYAKKWKMGFYHMAKSAKVPIVMASGDYKRKLIRIGLTIPYAEIESQPKEVILDKLEEHFQDINPRFPEKFNPKIY